MNVATLAGRVGADAELNYTKSGMAVASFSLAIDNGKGKDGEKKAPLWAKCVLWDKRAESLSKYITKGSVVVVSGPVSSEAWISKQDGTAQGKVVVTVNQFTFGGGSNASEASEPQQQRAAAPQSQPQGASPITDEDIPF